MPQAASEGSAILVKNEQSGTSGSSSQEWRSSVKMDLRNHLVGKLLKAICPSPDPNALRDQKLKDMIAYARKVEKEYFEKAGDREEYYKLLADKINAIQNDLLEKKGNLIRHAFRPPTNGQEDEAHHHSQPSSMQPQVPDYNNVDQDTGDQNKLLVEDDKRVALSTEANEEKEF